eukprot:963790_1
MMMMGETQGIERKLCGDLGLPLYVLVLPSIVLVLMLIMGVILLRNDLDFFATDYYDPNPAQTVNRSLLNSSRIGLGLVHVALVFKRLFSACLPHIEGVKTAAIGAKLLVNGPTEGNSGNIATLTTTTHTLLSNIMLETMDEYGSALEVVCVDIGSIIMDFLEYKLRSALVMEHCSYYTQYRCDAQMDLIR